MESKQEFGGGESYQAAIASKVEGAGAALVETPSHESAASSVSNSKLAASLLGKSVKTPFGIGVMQEYRTDDETFVIKLTSSSNAESFSAMAMLYTQTVPERYETPSEKADGLNVAYEALEKMRRMNLEVMCHEVGIYEEIDHEYCTTCLLTNKGSGQSHFPRLQKLVDQATATDLENFPRLHRLFHSTSNAESNGESKHEEDANSAGNRVVPPSNPQTNGQRSIEQSSNEIATETTINEPSTTLSGSHAEPPTAAQVEGSTAAGPTQGQLLEQVVAKQTQSSKVETTNFPRLRNVWGAIQSMPQPAASQAQNTPAQTLEGQETTKKSPAASFPRIRGLLDSTGATEMFHSISLSNPTKSSTADPASATESSTSFPRLRGAFDTSATSSLFGSLSLSQKRSDNPTPTKAPSSEKPKALPRIQKLIDHRHKANTSPCLICASPSCSAHSSASFRKEGITLCLQCEKLFELNFIVDCIATPDPIERAKNIDHMVDCYDRCMLLLEFSSQFADIIAKSLEQQKERQNKVGLASSSVGVLSGVLGIAAAATILTPAGPPLLIASLFFGGSATTVQTGTEAMNYFSEPRKLADRIIALHGMALSLLRVTSTLRDAMMRDHIRTDVYAVEPISLKNQVQEKIEKNRVAVLAGSNVGRSMALGGVVGAEVAGAGAVGAGAVVGAEVAGASAAGAVAAGAATEMGAAGAAAGAAGARGATAISRAGTAAARTVRFARFAGGALSAAVLVLEANAIQSTLKSIHDGSPCDKADTLRRVIQEVGDFPSSTDLDAECQAYLEVLASRPPPPPVVDAAVMPDNLPSEADIPEATCQEVTGEYQLCPPGAVILNGDASAPQSSPAPMATSSSSMASSFLGGSSLIQRYQDRQERRQHLAMSQAEEVVAVAVDDDQLVESSAGMSLLL